MSPASPERRQPEFASAPRRAEPSFSPPPPSAPTPAPVEEQRHPFETDAPASEKKFQFAGAARILLERLAELAARSDAPTPFAFGLLAPAGGGKSSALGWLGEKIADSGALVVRLDASELDAAPEQALAGALFRALAPQHGALAEAAAADAAHFRADAGALHRAAREKLDATRRQLIVEKQALAGSENRRAALKDRLLFETPGARVNLFMRKIKTGFAPRLRGFGFSGDPLASLRDLIRDVSDRGGLGARLLTSLRALYAFRGQTGLLIYAALSYGLGRGLDWTASHQGQLLDQLASTGSAGAQSVEFLREKLFWLAPAAQGFGWLALALIALNLWRAFAFMRPLVHGAALLDRDLADHRRDVEQTLALQARHVEQLEAEAEALSRQAAEAERRSNAAGVSRAPPAFLLEDASSRQTVEATGFLQALSRRLAGARPIVVAVDGLERLEQPARAFARQQALLAQPGFLAIFALDPSWFEAAPEDFARGVQLPLRLDRAFFAEAVALAPLDAPLSALETRLIAAVAPLAGPNPRAQKKWRNFYRFLRPAAAEAGNAVPAGAVEAALALLLAAEAGALPEDREALRHALAAPFGDFMPKGAATGSAALQHALNEIFAAIGPIRPDDARRAAALARQLTI